MRHRQGRRAREHSSPTPRPSPPASDAPGLDELLTAARDGDEVSFRRLTDPYVRELHIHCYRMLGSLHDAEDMVQETLLRAWRHLRTFESRSTMRAWLYRIATNACLSARTRDRARLSPNEQYGPIPDWNARDVDVVPLEPYPDQFLGADDADSLDPAARYDLVESVELAFLRAIHLLPPRQRAVLLLRDVLGWSAAEVAALLDTSVAAVNGMLQRARGALARERAAGRLHSSVRRLSDAVEQELLRRFVEAWRAADIERLVQLLTEDALLTMPPAPMAFRGRAAIGEFFATVPAGGDLRRIRLAPTRANRRPALAAYLLDDTTHRYEGYGLMVLTCTPEGISAITGFPDARLLPHFGLPSHLEP